VAALFKKILIANRGEIACRIIRTARRMGIPTAAVYSDADRGALHVDMADEAVPIGPAASAESYLAIPKIIAAARAVGADAVHPGYGFLSENPAFARRLQRAGITFIGPPAAAIKAMGDKITSKALAKRAGVNVIPGGESVLKGPAQAAQAARRIGYPVMLKASAGGGGKGMRIAENDSQARDGFRAAVNEAETAFGDGRVFCEKYIEHPRHIEIQILADGHGNVVHLGERECSIQRRHQKVIEEAPSPFVDDALRREMGEHAVKLARAVKYRSAGTVEFVVGQDGDFYFLEMNTRLQVEHPVTECVTGLDLVEQMIRVAAGEKLSFAQDGVRIEGWAVEARVYAEDPVRGFLPSAGRLVRYRAPEESAGLRVDAGVFEGAEVSPFYDPMIAKVVTHGPGRAAAILHMRHALDRFYISGVSHNIGFLSAVLANRRFQAGKLSTGFIAQEFGDHFRPRDIPHDEPKLLAAVAAVLHQAYADRVMGGRGRGGTDWVVDLSPGRHPASVHVVRGGYDVAVGPKAYQVRTDWRLGESLFHARINGGEVCLQVGRRGVRHRIVHAGAEAEALVLAPRAAELAALMPKKKAAAKSKFVRAPMPGLLRAVSVSEGQLIKAGEVLCVIEAMKMENVLRADRDGAVAKVRARPGDSLAVDAVILEYK